jgi:surface protein
MATIIVNDYIHDLIAFYIEDRQELPPDLREVPINDWDVSRVTDMNGLFRLYETFNEYIGDWDVSNVTDMSYMFDRCSTFNQPLNSWNVSRVTNMSTMFGECVAFNQPLNDWDVSNVTDMSTMFGECATFNQPLNNWNVSNVTNMSGMFQDCTNFNQNISNWNVSRVTDIEGMYENCGISQLNKAVRRARPQPRPQPIPQPIPQHQPVVYDVNMNQGRANEVHERFNALNIHAITQFIDEFNRTHPINAKILEGDNIEPPYLFTPLSRFIHNSELFVPTEKRANKAKLQRVSRLIQGYESATPEQRRLLRAIVEFVSKQNDDFIQQYILILSDECLNAYGIDDESCAKGAYERSITTLDAVATVLITEDKYRDNETYNQLKEQLFPKMNFVEVVQQWSETYLEGGPRHNELEGLNIEERKKHFIEFMREKYQDNGLYRPVIEKQIQEEATLYEQMGVFERLAFGGKKKRRNTKKKGKRQNTEKRKGGKKRKTEKKVKKSKKNESLGKK